jgi:hypothetical protein
LMVASQTEMASAAIGLGAAKWQDAAWPSATCSKGGLSRRHMSRAIGQRELNAHPGGTAEGLGTSPASTMRRRGASGSGSGTADSRDKTIQRAFSRRSRPAALPRSPFRKRRDAPPEHGLDLRLEAAGCEWRVRRGRAPDLVEGLGRAPAFEQGSIGDAARLPVRTEGQIACLRGQDPGRGAAEIAAMAGPGVVRGDRGRSRRGRGSVRCSDSRQLHMRRCR